MAPKERHNAEASERRTKVARLIEKYGVRGIGDELERAWTAVGDEHRSLRDLAAEFNVRILQKAMEDANLRAADEEAETIYRILTDESVSSGDRTRVERRLEREGVDAHEIQTDFVSYQAVRSYLQKVRGAEYTPDRGAQVEKERRNVQKLLGRTEAVTRTKIDQLRSTERLALGEYTAFVDVRIVCNECDGQFHIDELLEAGGCDCDVQTTSDN